jgi:hypothetical protein
VTNSRQRTNLEVPEGDGELLVLKPSGFTPEGLPRIGDPRLDAPRARIMAAMKAHHIFPPHSASIDNLEQLIKAGVMVTHGTSIELTNKRRAFTKRQMPY